MDVRVLAVSVFRVALGVEDVDAGGHHDGAHVQLPDFFLFLEVDGLGTAVSFALAALGAQTASETALAFVLGHLGGEPEIDFREIGLSFFDFQHGHLLARNGDRSFPFGFGQLLVHGGFFRFDGLESAVGQVVVDGHRGLAALSDGLHEAGCAQHAVAAGEYALHGGGHGVFVGRDHAPLVGFQADRLQVGEVRGLADGRYHVVHFQNGLGTLHRHRTSSAGSVGFAQFHLDVFQSGELALFADEPGGGGQEMKLDAFQLGLFHLDVPGGHFGAGPSVKDRDFLGAQSPGGPGAVDGHVATADDHHFFAQLDRLVQGGFPEHVGAGDDAFQVLALHAQGGALVESQAQEEGLVALLL